MRSLTNKYKRALRHSGEDSRDASALIIAQLNGPAGEWVTDETLSATRRQGKSWGRLMRLDKHVWPPSR